MLGVDVVDLDREGKAGAENDLAFGKEHGQVGVVLHRRGAALGNLELDGEAEIVSVPVARPFPVADGKAQMIETDHDAS